MIAVLENDLRSLSWACFLYSGVCQILPWGPYYYRSHFPSYLTLPLSTLEIFLLPWLMEMMWNSKSFNRDFSNSRTSLHSSSWVSQSESWTRDFCCSTFYLVTEVTLENRPQELLMGIQVQTCQRLHDLLGPRLLQMALENNGLFRMDVPISWLNMGSESLINL